MNCKIISFLVCVKSIIIILTTAIAAGMNRQIMIRKWTCTFCRVMKNSGSRLDWMCLPCDDLTAFLLLPFSETVFAVFFRCPSCGHQLPASFTAFTWLVTHQQAAYDDEKREDCLNAIEWVQQYQGTITCICTYISIFSFYHFDHYFINFARL